METSLFSATRQIGSTFTMLADSITSIVAGNTTYTGPDGTTKTSAIGTLVQQTASNVVIQATSSATTASQAGAAVITSLINVATSGVTIAAAKVDIFGATEFVSGYLSKSNVKKDRQQVYIQAASGTSSVTAPSAWVTATGESVLSDDTSITPVWTTKRPTYNPSFPLVFVATQAKDGDDVVTCTTPLRDDTTTIVDGGHVTTGTIDATVVGVVNVDAGNITSGTIDADLIAAGSIAIGNLTPEAQSAISDAARTINEYVAATGQWVRTDDSGVTIGSASSTSMSRITSDRQSFLSRASTGDQFIETAYTSGGVFHANSMEADELHAGSFMWVGRSNGNISLKYVG